ncbi:DUF4214 domain-containing protein [Nguyenibacter vanlangensis]|uniref:DUF4214 domain-containing protein n=1 Tax=Nguyenibacter vanlangensis TaxID=1216886 RepID=A0A7Y7ITK4_9PROT|nr:DUF4214 domain-containing protein [Nguyenibacter vanlangensis]NVN10124.1 DUF4214 domain-containing protein [Nguyenibacter vanlangensis]
MMVAAADTSDGDGNIVVIGTPPSSGGGDISPVTGGGGGGGGSVSSDSGQHIMVYGHHVAVINGVKYLENNAGTAVLTQSSFDGTSTNATPLRLSQVDQAVQDATESELGRSPSDQDYSNAYGQLGNGSSMASVRSSIAHSQEATNDINGIWQHILGRQPDSGALNYLEDQMASGQESLGNIAYGTAHSQEATNDVNGIWTRILGRTPDSGALNYLEDQMASGQRSMNDIAYGTAHSQEATNDVNGIWTRILGRTPDSGTLNYLEDQMASGQRSMNDIAYGTAYSQESLTNINGGYQIILDRNADSGGQGFYANELAQGQSLANVFQQLATSQEAQTQIANFLSRDVGQINDSLINNGQTMLSDIAQAYQAIRNYTSEELQTAANNFSTQFNSSTNALGSLMPQTWQGWLGLASTLVLLSPLAPEAAGAEAIAGGANLLTTALDVELHTAAIFETRATVSALPDNAISALEEAKTFIPNQTGRTLQLDENTTVTQINGTKSRGAIVFQGGSDDSVINYFRKITGYNGDLNSIVKKDFGNGQKVWAVNTPEGNFALRNYSASAQRGGLDKWTIDFPEDYIQKDTDEFKFNF